MYGEVRTCDADSSWAVDAIQSRLVRRRLLSSAEFAAALRACTSGESAAMPAFEERGLGEVRLALLDAEADGEARIAPTGFFTVAVFGCGECVVGGADVGDSGRAKMFVGGPTRSFDYRWRAPHRATWVCLEPRFVLDAAAECDVGWDALDMPAQVVPNDKVCEHLVAALAEESAFAPYPLQKLLVESVARALVRRMLVRFAPAVAVPVCAPGALNGRAFDAVREYIDAHLEERVTLERLAAVAGVSRFHFARQFRLRTGESPMGYLLRLRIERAQQLLREGRVAVGRLAVTLGFADQSHFTRTFKRVVGVTPSDYRAAAAASRGAALSPAKAR